MLKSERAIPMLILSGVFMLVHIFSGALVVAEETVNKQDLMKIQAIHQREVGKLRGKVAQLKQEVDALQRTLSEIVTDRHSHIHLRQDPTVTPDGKITEVQPQQVIINLAKKDRLLPGLRFEVYDPRLGILPDRFGNHTGKATIEVLTIREKDAVCRVVRRGLGERVAAGDVIGNVIYHPKQKIKFYVWGYLGMDRFGEPKNGGAKRIADMVKKWGGDVTVPDFSKLDERTGLGRQELKTLLQAAIKGVDDHNMDQTLDLLKSRLEALEKKFDYEEKLRLPWRFLTPDLDFVILGKEPVIPAEPDELTSDPLHRKWWEQKNRDYQFHKAIEAEALDLGITVLNQNRFLQMIGHHE